MSFKFLNKGNQLHVYYVTDNVYPHACLAFL